MRPFIREDQDAKVGIDRNQDPVIVDRPLQDCSVTGIVTQLGSLDGVVSLIPQPLCKARQRSGRRESASLS